MEERADHSVNKLVSCNNCLLKQSLLLHGFTSLKTFPGAQRAQKVYSCDNKQKSYVHSQNAKIAFERGDLGDNLF